MIYGPEIERCFPLFNSTNFQRSRKEGLDYGEREDGDVSEEGEIAD
jgi:hypothetical protein